MRNPSLKGIKIRNRLPGFWLLPIIFILFGCGGGNGDSNGTSSTGTVAAPTFSPQGGTYNSAQAVSLSTSTAGASIRYTTDGSTPSSTTGNLYSGPITVLSTTTLKAVAYENGMNPSSVESAAYMISNGSNGSPTSNNLLYLKAGDPSNWTTQGASGSQYKEISTWQDAGYTVQTMDLSNTDITDALLANYKVLRINGSSGKSANLTSSEGEAIYNWVIKGGMLIADTPFNNQVVAVDKFGVDRIDGENGGSTGRSWYFYGAPLTIGPVTGPNGEINTLACESMDHPVLKADNTLTIDAEESGYPAIVHGSFGDGKIVIIFAASWSADASYPGNAYQANIGEGDNLQFLYDCIDYLGTGSAQPRVAAPTFSPQGGTHTAVLRR